MKRREEKRREEKWEREVERSEKKSWYKNCGFDSILFVPSTPEGKLRNLYQGQIVKSGLRIKVVETTGMTLKRQLQTSNPFKRKQCGREQCFVL